MLNWNYGLIMATDRHDKLSDRQWINRRRMMQLMGAAGVGAAAGCLGDDDDDDDDDDPGIDDGDDADDADDGDDDDDEPDRYDQWFYTASFDNIDEYQFNRYNPTLQQTDNTLIFEPLLAINPMVEEFEFYPFLVEEVTLDGADMTLEVAEGFEWHNGDEITGEDVYNQFLLDWYVEQSAGGHQFIEEVELIDDYEVGLTLTDTFNRELMIHRLLDGSAESLSVNGDVYAEWFDRFEDAGDDESALEDVTADLFSWVLDSDDVVGSGPFEIDEHLPDELVLTRYDGSPWAENINFSGYIIDETLSERSLWYGDRPEIDGFGHASMRYEELDQFGEHTDHWRWYAAGGQGLVVDLDNPHLGRPEFRKAIQHLCDTGRLVRNANTAKMDREGPQALLDEAQQEQFLGDQLDEFTHYEYDPALAEEMLEEAGYTKQDDQWTDDGEPIEVEMLITDWSAQVGFGQTIASEAELIGLDISLRSVDATTWFERRDNQEFDITPEWWGSPHPYDYYVDLFSGAIQDMMGVPSTFTTTPVGEPDGDEFEVNTEELAPQLPTMDSDEMIENIRQLAWIINQEMLMPHLTSWSQTMWIYRLDRWNFEPEDDGQANAESPLANNIRWGNFTATGESL